MTDRKVIYLDDAIDALAYFTEKSPTGRTAQEVAKDLPSAQPEPQWIPCSERLPDKTDDYLCSYNGCAVVDICEYDPDRNEWGFFYDGGWKVVSNVTAWMPIPEPYRSEEDAK